MAMINNERVKGIFLVLLAGISWGVISLFIRNMNAVGIDGKNVAALRSILAAVFLCIAMPVINRKAFLVKWRDLWCLLGCGIGSITLFNILYFATMQRTTVGVAVILLYTSPIFVTAMSCLFFGEKFTKNKLLALLLVTIGCIFVSGITNSTESASLSLSTLLMGIGSGFAYALFSIFGRCAQNRGYSADAITLWSFIFSGTASLLLLDWNTSISIIAQNGPSLWFILVGLVLISTILPYFIYTAGLKHLSPSTAAIAAAVEPVVGTLVGIIAFHESLSLGSFVGMVMIIAAMFL